MFFTSVRKSQPHRKREKNLDRRFRKENILITNAHWKRRTTSDTKQALQQHLSLFLVCFSSSRCLIPPNLNSSIHMPMPFILHHPRPHPHTYTHTLPSLSRIFPLEAAHHDFSSSNVMLPWHSLCHSSDCFLPLSFCPLHIFLFIFCPHLISSLKHTHLIFSFPSSFSIILITAP